MTAEVPLAGGRTRAGVVRVGDTVRRPMTSRSPFVHGVLEALAAAGVTGVPRLLGVDELNREILSFQPGETGHAVGSWSDEQLAAVAALTRRIHDALAGSAAASAEETVCHRDIAPWNVVLGQGGSVGVIDFDGAEPGPRADDLGYLAWVFLDLGPGGVAASVQARRLRVVLDGYGAAGLVSGVDLVDAIRREQQRILAYRLDQAATAPDPSVRAFAAERVEEIRAAVGWVDRHRVELASAEPLREHQGR